MTRRSLWKNAPKEFITETLACSDRGQSGYKVSPQILLGLSQEVETNLSHLCIANEQGKSEMVRSDLRDGALRGTVFSSSLSLSGSLTLPSEEWFVW